MNQTTARTLDGAVLFWCVLWCVLGVWTGVTLWQAADVGETISSSGRSLTKVGEGLQGLSDIPVIGEGPGEVGAEVAGTGAEITDRGAEVQGQLRLLGIFIGVAVVGIPVTPVLGLYLPLRVRRAREVALVRRQLEEHGDDPGFDRHLADRARLVLTYDEVARLDSDRALADAELARLGLARRR
ncbi:hypothetical protein [Nocardioides coralli]|uniref:hypothetical protein n=1 Tax=Nocardioides coralli TaxID=2872154 RepID=UPI001CA3D180|nr:hypothetical protein [Nocardioides coralli]QZY29189.1 hypothetical protein K6T13_00180 [Nocardioides coralli]